jgi:hypothetical protein
MDSRDTYRTPNTKHGTGKGTDTEQENKNRKSLGMNSGTAVLTLLKYRFSGKKQMKSTNISHGGRSLSGSTAYKV